MDGDFAIVARTEVFGDFQPAGAEIRDYGLEILLTSELENALGDRIAAE